ncbi:10202_t:CDS:2 [Entrophospora sp. SA101]|nr:10202_t:CDS:2 [Entrophospora sp. SA101]
MDYFYPLEKRNEITSLDISNKTLEGEMKINNFPNLERIDLKSVVEGNKIPTLALVNLTSLKSVTSNSGNWSGLVNFASLNPEKLIELEISNNNLRALDLSCLSNFINLEVLKVGCDEYHRRNNKQKRNRFFGSLESLKNMTKLKTLDINNTDIDSGLEYLPEILEKVVCADSNKKTGSYKIREELKDYAYKLKDSEAKDTDYLEKRIKELESLIKKHKEKIVAAFLRFAPAKELLRELIVTHLEYTKFKKQESDSLEYDECCESYEEKCQAIKKQLREEKKLTKEEMNEQELEVKRNEKQLLLEEGQKQHPQITISGTVHGSVLIGPLQIGANTDFSSKTFNPSSQQLIQELQIFTQQSQIKETSSETSSLKRRLSQLAIQDSNEQPKLKKIDNSSTNNQKQLLEIDLIVKQTELDSLFQQTKSKISKYEQTNQDHEFTSHSTFLNDLLENQRTLTIYQHSPNISENQINTVQGQLTGSKNNLLHIITSEELAKICQLKEEIVKLEISSQK